jgi:hypothetical protein
MDLQKIKMIVSAGWVLTAVAVAVSANMSWPLLAALALVGTLPPLALLMWWNEPTQTMSEAINKARR